MAPEDCIWSYFCSVWLTICKWGGISPSLQKNTTKAAESPSHPCLTHQHWHLAPAAEGTQKFGLKGLALPFEIPGQELQGGMNTGWCYSGIGGECWSGDGDLSSGRGAAKGELCSVPEVLSPCSSPVQHSSSAGKWGEAYGERSCRESCLHPSPHRPWLPLLVISLSLLITRSKSMYCLILTWF